MTKPKRINVTVMLRRLMRNFVAMVNWTRMDGGRASTVLAAAMLVVQIVVQTGSLGAAWLGYRDETWSPFFFLGVPFWTYCIGAPTALALAIVGYVQFGFQHFYSRLGITLAIFGPVVFVLVVLLTMSWVYFVIAVLVAVVPLVLASLLSWIWSGTARSANNSAAGGEEGRGTNRLAPISQPSSNVNTDE